MHFNPCKAETAIWIRAHHDVCEYIAVYVDDLAISMKDPSRFMKEQETKYGVKLKGPGPIKVHLGCDFF